MMNIKIIDKKAKLSVPDIFKFQVNKMLIRNLKDLAFVASGKLHFNGPTIFLFFIVEIE